MEKPIFSPKEIKSVIANFTHSVNKAEVVSHAFSLEDYGMTKVHTTTQDSNPLDKPIDTAIPFSNKIDSPIKENKNNTA